MYLAIINPEGIQVKVAHTQREMIQPAVKDKYVTLVMCLLYLQSRGQMPPRETGVILQHYRSILVVYSQWNHY